MSFGIGGRGWTIDFRVGAEVLDGSGFRESGGGMSECRE
jgi:hypothetical protein